jgi:hypothetical protein
MGKHGDITTAIQGHLWVIQHANDKQRQLDSVRALIDLENFISSDGQLAQSNLPAKVNNAISEAHAQFKTSAEEETPTDVCVTGALFLLGVSVISYFVYGVHTWI